MKNDPAFAKLAVNLAALALLLALFVPAPAAAGDITLSYANFPPAPTFPCVQMERWADEVEKRTSGKVTVETYPGGTLLDAKNMFQGVMMGQADIGCLCMAYQPGVFPMTTVVEQPVGFTSSTVASMTLFDLYQKYKPAEFEDVVVLTMFTTAPSNIMSRDPVRSLDDLSGLELRASGSASLVLEKLGATPVSMPMPETPEALQKGVVQGLLSSLEVMMDFNFAEYCRYATMINAQVYPFAVVMNKDSFNTLPDDVKHVFTDLAAEQALWTGQYMDEHVKESLAWSKEKYNIEIITLPEDQMAKAEANLAPMVQAWKAKAEEIGLPAGQILDDLYAIKAEYEAKYGK